MRLPRPLRRWWKNRISYRSIISVIRDLPRWLFLGSLIYAPWAYGATTVESIKTLDLTFGIVIGLWFIELLIRRRKPQVPLVVVGTGAVILLLGWVMALNGRGIYDEHFQIFLSVPRRFDWAPSSMDKAISFAWMVRGTVLIGCICFVADLCLRERWLLRIWFTTGIAGGSIALFGLLQKATGAGMPFWHYTTQPVSTFFASYYYHANAAAFLNLVLPPTAGLALRALRKPQAHLGKAGWFAATLLVLLAMAVNTSRMGQVVGLLVIVAVAVGPARRPLWRSVRSHRITAALVITLTAVVIFVIAQSSRVDKPIERWRSHPENLLQDERWLVFPIALEALPEAGLFGYGPGVFRVVFPHYLDVTQKHKPTPGLWTYLHQDYLETLLEWGWIGSALWALLLFGGIGAGLQTLNTLRKRNIQNRWRRLLPLLLIALGSTIVHATVDFPLQIYSIELYAATYLGICWGSARAISTLRY